MQPLPLYFLWYRYRCAYHTAFAASAARTWPTFHAVVRSVSLLGFGIVPFLTPRHIVAADTPYNRMTIGNLINALFGVLSKFSKASGIV